MSFPVHQVACSNTPSTGTYHASSDSWHQQPLRLRTPTEGPKLGTPAQKTIKLTGSAPFSLYRAWIIFFIVFPLDFFFSRKHLKEEGADTHVRWPESKPSYFQTCYRVLAKSLVLTGLSLPFIRCTYTLPVLFLWRP